MYKKHLLNNIKRELDLLKQLAQTIEEKDLAFRPTEKVRSTLELMQYLSGIGSYIFRRFIKDDITPEVREELLAYRSTLTLENFQERLDEEWKAIQNYMEAISEDDLCNKEIEMPWKEKMALGDAIINAPIKWLAVYRMQLFLYLKLNGRPELGTKDAWVPKN